MFMLSAIYVIMKNGQNYDNYDDDNDGNNNDDNCNNKINNNRKNLIFHSSEKKFPRLNLMWMGKFNN